VVDHGIGGATCGQSNVEGRCWSRPQNSTCDGAPDGDVGFRLCYEGAGQPCNGAAKNLCVAVSNGDFYPVCF